MQQGLLVSGLETRTLIEALEMAAEIGYRNCEIGALPDDWRPNLATLDEEARRLAASRAADLGLRISSVQCHLHNGYADASRTVRQHAVDHTRRMVEMCARLGIPICHTVSGVAGDRASWETKADRVAEAYRGILDHARGAGVRVAIEPVFIYVIGNLEHTQALLKRLDNRPDLYLNYDPSHFPYHDESPEAFVHALGARIIHAHSKDAVVRPVAPEAPADGKTRFAMSGGRCFSFAVPGTGALDWSSILAALKDVGFNGVVSLEMGHGYEGSPKQVAREVYWFFRDRHGFR